MLKIKNKMKTDYNIFKNITKEQLIDFIDEMLKETSKNLSEGFNENSEINKHPFIVHCEARSLLFNEWILYKENLKIIHYD